MRKACDCCGNESVVKRTRYNCEGAYIAYNCHRCFVLDDDDYLVVLRININRAIIDILQSKRFELVKGN